MDHYTYEDYLKDFEFDYLGFHGVKDEPVSALPSEQIADDAFESENCDPTSGQKGIDYDSFY